jgi:hypothetical protein
LRRHGGEAVRARRARPAIANILANGGDFLHADFGGGGAYGIPYVTVAGNQPAVPINFFDWPEESDPGPVRTK